MSPGAAAWAGSTGRQPGTRQAASRQALLLPGWLR
eukprot:COSAG01_NODE_1508_length_10054_cov_3.434713_11_plen_35_part_00